MNAAISGPDSESCSRVSGLELPGEEGEVYGGLVSAEEEKELNAEYKFKVPQRLKSGPPSKSIVDTSRALSREMAGGEKDVKARTVAKGYKGPDLQGGSVDAPGYAGLRSSHPRVIFLRAFK